MSEKDHSRPNSAGLKSAKEDHKPSAGSSDLSDTSKTTLKPSSSRQTSNSNKEPSVDHSKSSIGGFTQIKVRTREDTSHDSGNKQHEVALTRIGKSIREQDSSRGFLKAKQAADRALAEDKIILNKRFVLEATLGAGGMGTVYRAKDLRKVEASDLQPNIAVKVLNEEFKDHPDAFVTLQREASRSHILSHPNIVTVHDFDRDGDVIYMTMELLEGRGLETIIRQHQPKGLPRDEAFKIVVDFCQALEYAHKKNIIHSDLKPGNIFITDDGAKILDFGIARLANTALDDFDAGSLGALTPSYASLEMIKFDAPAAGDDVYAAAIIAYELLCGEHPYDRKTADKALEEGLKPVRIPGLSNRSWKALESALRLKREDRTSSIAEFYRRLTQKKKVPIFKWVSALLVIAVSTLAYSYLFKQNELEDIVEQTYAKSQTCLETGDYVCATESLKALIEMSPDHPDAAILLKKVEEKNLEQKINVIFSEGKSCLKGEAPIVCAQAKLTELRKLDQSGDKVIALSKKVERFEMQERLVANLERANKCFELGDYTCAIAAAEAVLEDSVDNEQATVLIGKVNSALERIEKDEALLVSRYLAHLKNSEVCFAKKEFDCALAESEKALAIKNNDAEATALKQKSIFSKKQAQDNLQKAQRLLSKAKICFDRKNYTCAISNSESALEFVSSYAPAKALRKLALDEQEAIKKSFSIQ